MGVSTASRAPEVQMVLAVWNTIIPAAPAYLSAVSPGHEERTQVPSNDTFFAIALSRGVVLRATRVALIVGTMLAVINHGDRILALSLTGGNVLQILLTYLVPYAVSTWSAVGAVRERPAA